MKKTSGVNRRGFLKGSSMLVGGLAASPFQLLGARQASGKTTRAAFSPDYGPLSPVNDQNTGLPLIKLPAGFTYTTLGWAGDLMSDGTPTPGLHDGMAVVKQMGPQVLLIRNHEVRGLGSSFGSADITYDGKAGGGTTNLIYHTGEGKVHHSWASIAGTNTNCAGGRTPWETWITCEETVDGPELGFEKTHGWSFEVPSHGKASTEPLRAMGRFVKEAVAVDPKTGIVYETEDRGTSGLYRYTDKLAGAKKNINFRLSGEGTLEMLKVKGVFKADLRTGVVVGTILPVEWVPIADPERAHRPGTSDTLGVFGQGRDLGGAQFARLEGIWSGNDIFYFNSTSGGAAGRGQVWSFDPVSQTIELHYVSPGSTTLDMPDNITVSPRGGVVLCEDGNLSGQRFQGLDASGTLFPFAINDMILNGEKNGHVGDFRGIEWAGATFSPDGKWLFANLQTPGITFAISGPWENGAL